MRAATRWVVVLLLSAGAAGCFKQTFHVGEGAPAGEIVYDHWENHWIFGLIGPDDIDVASVCPSGNATIHQEMSFLNGLVNALVGGIYSPRTVTIRCAEGGEADVELDEDALLAIVTSDAFLSRVGELLPERLGEARLGVAALEESLAPEARRP
ncbi:MAG: hypothetical protein D6701_05450 [Gemmatimonadetes bacterium]|nr:MAG: hypothetical protein D6701_05450 [Gemmatimonadota bacterium]